MIKITRKSGTSGTSGTAGTSGTSGASGATDLHALSDVSTTGAGQGSLLKYDGSSTWEPGLVLHISTATPTASDGDNGDLWFTYTP